MTCTCVFAQILVETSTCSQWKISHWNRGCPKETVTPWEGCTEGRTHVGAHGELYVMGEIPVPWCCWWTGVMEFRRKVKPERKEGMGGRSLKFWVCFSFPCLDLIVNNLIFLSAPVSSWDVALALRVCRSWGAGLCCSMGHCWAGTGCRQGPQALMEPGPI